MIECDEIRFIADIRRTGRREVCRIARASKDGYFIDQQSSSGIIGPVNIRTCRPSLAGWLSQGSPFE